MANSAGKHAVDRSPSTAIATLSAISKQPQVASPTTASHFQESSSGKCDEPLNDPFTLCLAPAADADPGARFDQPHCDDNMTPRSSTHNLPNPPNPKVQACPGNSTSGILTPKSPQIQGIQRFSPPTHRDTVGLCPLKNNPAIPGTTCPSTIPNYCLSQPLL